MKKLFQISIVILFISVFSACKQEDDPTLDNPSVVSIQVDSTLKSYYPNPLLSSTFESIFNTSFANGVNGFVINMDWNEPTAANGLYLHFNDFVGDVLLDENGFIKAFNSGVKIDSTLAGTWSGNVDGIISFDYILNPLANKGNLAGQGDKYIVFRAFSEMLPTYKYYGNLRLRVSADGRDVKIIAIAYHKNPNVGFTTGEF